MSLRGVLLIIGAGLGLSLLASAPASAATKSPAMQACSDEWAKLKSDNKVPDGQTWPKFWSQCSKDYAAAHPDAAAADKMAAPASTDKMAAPAAGDKMAAPAKAAAAKEPASTDGKGKSAAMSACSDQWAKLKADDKVPAGQTWPKFWSQCSKDYAAAHPDDSAMAPKKNAMAVQPADDTEGVPLPDPEQASRLDPDKTTVNKRELTPGQKAAIVRIRACGAEWQANKKAGKLPQGAKWPQYWSDCNKRLKAQGQ